MKKIILFFVLFFYAFGANLLTHNIYERTDRVDIMLSFDSPYEGKIYQVKNKNGISLKLEDLSFNKIIKKEINSNIIQSLSIKPDKNNLFIILTSKNDIGVIASKTADGFGLRIRSSLLHPSAKKSSNTDIYQINKTDKLQTFQDSNLLDTRYIIVIVFLFILLLFMFWVKRRVAKKQNQSVENSWLFKKGSSGKEEIKIIKRKPIDANNSVILVEFEDKRYLLASGNSNVLLDTFGQSELEEVSDFEKAFEDNRKKLDDYLKLQDQKLNSYKDRASNEYETRR